MAGLSLGAVLGLLFGLLLMVVFISIGTSTFNDRVETLCRFGAIASVIVSILLGGALGVIADYHTYQSQIEQFEISKAVIESSITNENLSGFERAELVKQAVEENKTLIKLQYACEQWYGFNVPNRVLELTPICLD